MSEDQISEEVLRRLRDNLRAANIPFTEEDIVGIGEKGFLKRMAAFEEVIAREPADHVPDYLAAWGEEVPAAPAPVGDPQEHRQQPGLIADIAGLIRTRQLSPVELLDQTLARIDQRDGELGAFQVMLHERARAAAQRAESEIAAGIYRGPLHGIPIAVKDLLDVAGVPTTAGSKILANNVPTSDATAVERLEAAGAAIVGKTRMSEFAYSPGSNNAHYGPTRNPWNLQHDTGGSSSGSGAAVAAGLVLGALGSDTGGSIRMPAAQCGIVGLKPTFGLVSLNGAVTLSWSLDHLGPMTRSVGDAALLLDLLAGYDERDPRTRKLPPQSYSAGLGASVKGLRIGVLRDDGSPDFGGASEDTLAVWRAGLAALERAGAELVPIDVPDFDGLRWLNSSLLAMEAATFHEPFLRERLDDYGEFMRQRILAAFAYTPRALVRAQQARAAIRRRCNALFEQIDLLSTPSMPDVAPLLGVPTSTNFTAPFNILGWPTITVPVGVGAGNLPLGLQLAGRPFDDATVLRAGHALESEIAWSGLSKTTSA